MALRTSTFNPFETRLDAERSLEILRHASTGGDDGELFLERHRSQSLVYDDRRVRSASYSAREGFGLRAVLGEASGYAHSNDLSERALNRAADAVRFALGNGGGRMSPPPAERGKALYDGADTVGEITTSAKVEILETIDDYLRSKDRRVVQASISLAISMQEIEILRPDGGYATDRRPMSRLGISVIVEANGVRHTGYTGQGGRFSLSALVKPESWRPLADEALRVALIGLIAEPAPAGVMDVVLGPGWPGILLHEAVGHGLEGDFNRKGSSAFSGLMGKRVAAPGVTVIDDGTIPKRRGSITIDDEGTPSRSTVLIEDGILVGYLQDRQNARLTGGQSTGNGRRESFAHTPMPRMTNTFMKSGSAEPSDVLEDLKDGIYAVGFGGGQVDITSGKFVFSCTEAYRVRDGKIGPPVKNATLIGDGATALKNIRGIGNDLQLDPGIGNCGKNGQWVPVGVGLPTLMISGLTVGGQAV